MAGLVPGRLLRLLQPRDRLVDPAEVDQIGADVVVGVSEVRIDRDGDLALIDRLLVATLEAVGPAEERVGLGGRVLGDRGLVEADGVVEPPGHLALVRLLQEIHRALDPVLVRHGLPASPVTAGPILSGVG